MPSKFHYEDNLFFLHSILRTLDSGLHLDVDDDFFQEKIIEDILFIDRSLMRIFSLLKENTVLIRRVSYLRSLRRTVVAFEDFLDRFSSGALGFSKSSSSHYDRLTETRNAHRHVRVEIDSMLDAYGGEEDAHNVVSSQEFGFLLSHDAEDDR